jgi:hypothetical protein
MFTPYLHRFSLAALFVSGALLAAGCSPATQVVGTWDVDSSKALPGELFEANPLVAAYLAVAKPVFQIKFEGTGSFHVQYAIGPIKGEDKGTWRFVKAEGTTLLLMTKKAGETTESELRMTMVDNDHAEIVFPLPFGKKPMPFSFVKAKPSS